MCAGGGCRTQRCLLGYTAIAKIVVCGDSAIVGIASLSEGRPLRNAGTTHSLDAPERRRIPAEDIRKCLASGDAWCRAGSMYGLRSSNPFGFLEAMPALFHSSVASIAQPSQY